MFFYELAGFIVALEKLEDYFPDWKIREELAEKMIPIIGSLYRRNVVTYCFSRAMYNQSVTSLMKTHRWVRQIGQNELSEFETYPVLEGLSKLNLGPSHIDIGKLTLKYMKLEEKPDIKDFLYAETKEIIGRNTPPLEKPQDVVLYGFGRIGRLLARLLIEKTGGGQQLVLRAIVLRKGNKDDLEKRASLLRRDSTYGPFAGTIRIDAENNCLIINGNVVRFIFTAHRGSIDYTNYGISNALIIDNTGAWRTRDELQQHLDSKGASKVLLTSPGKDIQNIVYGVNSHLINSEQQILAAASCTTNAIVPVLKAINFKFGIEHGHMETVHAYTPDQNLLDNYHRKNRRGRSAPTNLVLTQTGASTAVADILPELEGKLTANAIRVPTPNVSLAILNLTVAESNMSVDKVNEYLRHTSLHSSLQRQIDFTASPEVVSTDFISNRHACIIDSEASIAKHNRIVIYAWYDNEFGYSCQVIRIVQKWAGIKYPLLPKDISGNGF